MLKSSASKQAGRTCETITKLSSSTRKNYLRQRTIDNWLWEYSVWCIGSIALLGLALTLGLHADQPLPDWPLHITVNALISLLSTLFASCLMMIISNIIGQSKWSLSGRPLTSLEQYDEASRGPWGSLLLLLRRTSLDIGSLGAIVTICNIATGPFLQQISSIGYMQVSTTQQSSIVARTNYLNTEFIPNMISNDLSYGIVPGVIVSSVYQGLYFTGNLSDVYSTSALQTRPYCPTGNCTYGIFDTLAISYQCADISSNLTTFVGNTSWGLPNGFNIGAGLDPILAANFTTSVLPNSSNIGVGLYPAVLAATAATYAPITLPTVGLPILNITAIQSCMDDNGVPCPGTAQECMLYWTLNRVQSEMIQDVLYEDVLASVVFGQNSTVTDMENGTYTFDTINPQDCLSCASSPQSNKCQLCTGISTGSNDNFVVSKWASASITDLTASLMTLTVENYNNSNNSTAALFASIGLYTTFPQLPLDMRPAFEALSISLSAGLRSSNIDMGETAGLRTVNGSATHFVPCTRVAWVWISLPASLHAAALGMLVYIGRRRRTDRPVWKSSAIAAIFFGARMEKMVGIESSSDKLVDMEVIASKIIL